MASSSSSFCVRFARAACAAASLVARCRSSSNSSVWLFCLRACARLRAAASISSCRSAASFAAAVSSLAAFCCSSTRRWRSAMAAASVAKAAFARRVASVFELSSSAARPCSFAPRSISCLRKVCCSASASTSSSAPLCASRARRIPSSSCACTSSARAPSSHTPVLLRTSKTLIATSCIPKLASSRATSVRSASSMATKPLLEDSWGIGKRRRRAAVATCSAGVSRAGEKSSCCPCTRTTRSISTATPSSVCSAVSAPS